MMLTPTEQERLTIFTAAELARKHRALGLKLSHPESVAYIADELLYGARAGKTLAELMGVGSTLLTTDDVLPGVAEMLEVLNVEAMFPDGAIDMVIVNVLAIDAVAGIVKGDIGIKGGRIVGIGKAGNPHIMAGVDPRLVVGPNTQILPGEGMIATVGGFDVHVHFVGVEQCANALASGITTMIGGALGPAFAVDCGGPWTTDQMLRAAEGFAMNFGFFAQARFGSVMNRPGQMAFTVTPRGAQSAAVARVKWISAAFVVS